MNGNAAPRPAAHAIERTDLEKLRLAAQVILDAAPGFSLVPVPLEVELALFRDRVEFMLLLPGAAAAGGELPWQRHAGSEEREHGTG